jgi:hypothetical protein
MRFLKGKTLKTGPKKVRKSNKDPPPNSGSEAHLIKTPQKIQKIWPDRDLKGGLLLTIPRYRVFAIKWDLDKMGF